MNFLRDLFTIERDSNYYIGKKLLPLKIKKNDIRVLRHIDMDKTINQNEICHILKEDKVTVAKSVKKMESLGYIIKAHNPEDKRQTLLTLTPSGQTARQRIRRILNDLNQIAMTDLSPEELALAEKLFEKISVNVHQKARRLKDK